ncbi:MAG: hypothetical protein SFW35_01675 [Chitinophagales bacterium]|nr:hypothetical protein [Chitinophagales bacterium]
MNFKPSLPKLLCLSLLLLLFSCSKEEFVDGVFTIHYSGDWDKGGCGWVLQQDTLHWYEPLNLPDQYKQENLELDVVYRQLEETPACSNNKIQGILYLHKIKEL